MLTLRGRPLGPFLGDGSAVVTAVLFALCIPSLAPWWISCIAMLFAIVVAKHLYGGLGHNVFNPAMVGYVVVLVSFPAELTQWLPPRALAAAMAGFRRHRPGHIPGLTAGTGSAWTPSPAPRRWIRSKPASEADVRVGDTRRRRYSAISAAWAGSGSPTGMRWAACGCCIGA